MDYDRIIGLLDKYWKCETTLPEEEALPANAGRIGRI